MPAPFVIPVQNIISLVVGEGADVGVNTSTFAEERDALLTRMARSKDVIRLPTFNIKKLPPEFRSDEPFVQGVLTRFGDEVIFGVAFIAREGGKASDTYMVSSDDMSRSLRGNLDIFARRIELAEQLAPQLNADGSAPTARFMPAGWQSAAVLN